MEIYVGSDFERALQIFTRRVLASGLLRELRDRRGYVKPSEKRKLKSLRARQREAKRLAKEVRRDQGRI